jgi:hypothetical protein
LGIAAGKKDSEIMPLDETLRVMRMLDEVREREVPDCLKTVNREWQGMLHGYIVLQLVSRPECKYLMIGQRE